MEIKKDPQIGLRVVWCGLQILTLVACSIVLSSPYWITSTSMSNNLGLDPVYDVPAGAQVGILTWCGITAFTVAGMTAQDPNSVCKVVSASSLPAEWIGTIVLLCFVVAFLILSIILSLVSILHAAATTASAKRLTLLSDILLIIATLLFPAGFSSVLGTHLSFGCPFELPQGWSIAWAYGLLIIANFLLAGAEITQFALRSH